jgi:hypothetical protein
MEQVYQIIGLPIQTTNDDGIVSMSRTALLVKIAEIVDSVIASHDQPTRADIIWALAELLPTGEMHVDAIKFTYNVALGRN